MEWQWDDDDFSLEPARGIHFPVTQVAPPPAADPALRAVQQHVSYVRDHSRSGHGHEDDDHAFLSPAGSLSGMQWATTGDSTGIWNSTEEGSIEPPQPQPQPQPQLRHAGDASETAAEAPVACIRDFLRELKTTGIVGPLVAPAETGGIPVAPLPHRAAASEALLPSEDPAALGQALGEGKEGAVYALNGPAAAALLRLLSAAPTNAMQQWRGRVAPHLWRRLGTMAMRLRTPGTLVWKEVQWEKVHPAWRRLGYRWAHEAGRIIEATPFISEAAVHWLLMRHVYPRCPHVVPLRAVLVQPQARRAGLVLDRMWGTFNDFAHRLRARHLEVLLFQAHTLLVVGQARVALKLQDGHLDNLLLGPAPIGIVLRQRSRSLPRSGGEAAAAHGRRGERARLWYGLRHPRTQELTWFCVKATDWWPYWSDFGFASATDPVAGIRIGRADLFPLEPDPGVLPGRHADVWRYDVQQGKWAKVDEWGPFDYLIAGYHGYDCQFLSGCLERMYEHHVPRTRLRQAFLDVYRTAAQPPRTGLTVEQARPRFRRVSDRTPREVVFEVFRHYVQTSGPPPPGTPGHYVVVAEEPVPEPPREQAGLW